MSQRSYWLFQRPFLGLSFIFFSAAIACSFSCFIFHIFVGGVCVAGVSQIIYVLPLHPKMQPCPSIHPSLPSPPPSPSLSNRQSGIDIISLEDPSLCQSLFIYSMATGLIMVSLPSCLSLVLSLILLASSCLSSFSRSLSLSGHCLFLT